MDTFMPIHHGRESRDAQGDIPRHQHRRAYAALVLSGGYEEAGDTGRRFVASGDVLVHLEFEAHANRFNGRADILNVPLPSQIELAPAGAVNDVDAIARLAARDLSAAADLLVELFHPAGHREQDWPDELAAALAAGCAQNVGQWSEQRGMVPETVLRTFRRVYGTTPGRFRRQVHAARACRRLAARNAPPLAALASELGYADQAHMTRRVKALLGKTPGALQSKSEV